MVGRLECDRYGVPQFDGQSELFEEYQERCWDLFYGRDGQDSLQVATPLHLRAQLTGAAYEAVRKLTHEKLRTKDSDGKATVAGMRLLIQTLKDSIAVEQPVKLNELFLTCFYSPAVWRKQTETMAQYIVRRENDFGRLKEASAETQVSANIRCLLLLLFSGLDAKEQQSILSSVGNEYDFEKVKHALRIQYPTTLPKQIFRRDYLGTSRSQPMTIQSKFRFKGSQKTRQVYAAEDYDDEVEEAGEEAYYEDDDGGEEDSPDAFVAYSDDEELEAFLGELTSESLKDPQVADAFATVAQHKMQKKDSFKKKGSGHGKPGATFPFKAQGDISFDKAKDQRKSAVKFLKSVTECTSCHQSGHWVGDPECPNAKKGKGKGSPGKKRPSPTAKKKASSNYFVLDDAIESDDEASLQFLVVERNDMVQKNLDVSVNAQVPENFKVEKSDAVADTSEVADEVYEKNFGEEAAANYAAGMDGSFTASFVSEDVKMPNVKTHSVLMVLKDTGFCEHSSYNGGGEKRYHRGANGHTRHVTCKDPACDKSVLVARRKEPLQLWRYLVLIAMCTRWGSAARSRSLAQCVAVCSLKAREEEDFEDKTVGRGYPRLSQGKAPSSSPSKSEVWDLVGGSGDEESQVPRKGKAKIIYEPEHQAWLYGVHLRQDRELPKFPELDDEDLKILQPLPSDTDTFTRGPLFGRTFVEAASLVEFDWYCRASLTHALENQPMTPEVFRFAFYLFGRVKLVHSAGMRMLKGDATSMAKRPADPSQMSSTRMIQVPLQLSEDPNNLQIQHCDVMMTSDNEAYVLSEQDPPGLALLDTGCSRTMHGADWASRFESELKEKGLLVKRKSKIQLFRGVGGETRSDVVKAFPVSIGGVQGEIFSAETPGSVPLLMSRPFMEKLGAVLNLRKSTVSFEEIGVKDLPLLKTSKGHLAVNLLDFPADDDEVPQHDALATSSTTSPGQGPLNSSCEFPDVEPYTPPKSSTPNSRASSSYPPPSDAYVDSDNPDIHDRRERLEEIDWMRREVEGYEEEMKRLREAGLLHEGFLCEDISVFESLVQDQAFPTRKTTQRKGKKLDNMNMVLDSKEIFTLRKLQGKNHEKVTRKPAAGKTWLKQLFAGQMGLSLMAVLYGMSIGVPLYSSSSDWDATSNRGHKWLHNDLQTEDPYVTVITHPCGPWGNWSRFNLAKGGQAAATVVENREATKPLLKLVNKTVKDRVKAKRHVFIEQPLGSESLHEPEMADVLEMAKDGRLIFIQVDGCSVGYKDKESGLPHKKPSYYITSMVAAESVFQHCFCDRSHEHQPLEGNNKFGSRTSQAAEWPQQLNKLVLEAIIQQSAIEKKSLQAVEESYPAEVRQVPDQGSGPNKRQRKRGRVAIISADAQAPPVYLRPEAVDEPELLPPEEEPPLDDADERAKKAAVLEPTLSMGEGERRHEWLKIDPEIRKIIRDLHVNFGHPTASTLQRILRRQNAKSEAIRAAGLMSCDACGESLRRRRPKPVRLPNRYEFNRHILVDTIYAKDTRGTTFSFLNIIDDATGFQVVCCLGELQGPPASRVVLRHFTSSWSSWAGLPHSMQVDRGKEYLANFSDFLKTYGVEQEVMPLEAPWKGGKCAKAGGLWKDLWRKTVLEASVSGLDDVLLATSIVTQARNTFPRSNGYAPIQWVLGVPDLRLPGALLDDDESQRLEVMEAAENPHSQMAKTLAIRESARVAQIRMDTDAIEYEEPYYINPLPQEDPFLWGPMCTSFVLNNLVMIEGTTGGLAQLGSLELNSEIPGDWRMRMFQQKVVNRTLIG